MSPVAVKMFGISRCLQRNVQLIEQKFKTTASALHNLYKQSPNVTLAKIAL
jgi:hypothetical protein